MEVPAHVDARATGALDLFEGAHDVLGASASQSEGTSGNASPSMASYAWANRSNPAITSASTASPPESTTHGENTS